MVNELRSHELYIEENGQSTATTLFILESPFDTELLEECACVGESRTFPLNWIQFAAKSTFPKRPGAR
jgi:hypothetical protein